MFDSEARVVIMKLKKHDKIIFTPANYKGTTHLATVHLVGRGGDQVGRVMIKRDEDDKRMWVSIKNTRRISG